MAKKKYYGSSKGGWSTMKNEVIMKEYPKHMWGSFSYDYGLDAADKQINADVSKMMKHKSDQKY